MAVVVSGGGIEVGSQIEPPDSAGPFTIRWLLSDRGVTARVFLAEDADGRQIVVKALRREHWQDDDVCRRFAREYDVLRRLRTQGGHVPEALHLHLQPDQPPYLVLSLARGKTLFEHTVQQPLGYLSEPLALALALPFLDTLAIAHRENISYTDWMLSEVYWDGEPDTFDPAAGIAPGSLTLIDWNVLRSLSDDKAGAGGDLRKFCFEWFQLLTGARPPATAGLTVASLTQQPQWGPVTPWVRHALARGLLPDVPNGWKSAEALGAELKAALDAWALPLDDLLKQVRDAARHDRLLCARLAAIAQAQGADKQEGWNPAWLDVQVADAQWREAIQKASRHLASGYPAECLGAVQVAARNGPDDADADRRLLVESAWECAARGVLAARRGALTARDFATLAGALGKLFPAVAETAPLPSEAAPALRAVAEAGRSPHFLTLANLAEALACLQEAQRAGAISDWRRAQGQAERALALWDQGSRTEIAGFDHSLLWGLGFPEGQLKEARALLERAKKGAAAQVGAESLLGDAQQAIDDSPPRYLDADRLLQEALGRRDCPEPVRQELLRLRVTMLRKWLVAEQEAAESAAQLEEQQRQVEKERRWREHLMEQERRARELLEQQANGCAARCRTALSKAPVDLQEATKTFADLSKLALRHGDLVSDAVISELRSDIEAALENDSLRLLDPPDLWRDAAWQEWEQHIHSLPGVNAEHVIATARNRRRARQEDLESSWIAKWREINAICNQAQSDPRQIERGLALLDDLSRQHDLLPTADEVALWETEERKNRELLERLREQDHRNGTVEPDARRAEVSADAAGASETAVSDQTAAAPTPLPGEMADMQATAPAAASTGSASSPSDEERFEAVCRECVQACFRHVPITEQGVHVAAEEARRKLTAIDTQGRVDFAATCDGWLQEIAELWSLDHRQEVLDLLESLDTDSKQRIYADPSEQEIRNLQRTWEQHIVNVQRWRPLANHHLVDIVQQQIDALILENYPAIVRAALQSGDLEHAVEYHDRARAVAVIRNLPFERLSDIADLVKRAQNACNQMERWQNEMHRYVESLHFTNFRSAFDGAQKSYEQLPQSLKPAVKGRFEALKQQAIFLSRAVESKDHWPYVYDLMAHCQGQRVDRASPIFQQAETGWTPDDRITALARDIKDLEGRSWLVEHAHRVYDEYVARTQEQQSRLVVQATARDPEKSPSASSGSARRGPRLRFGR